VIIGFNLRYKEGFLIGVLVAVFVLLLIFSSKDYPFKQQISTTLIGLSSMLILTTLGFLFISLFRRKSVISPAGDGFVYGFVGVLDVTSVYNGFLSGHLPAII